MKASVYSDKFLKYQDKIHELQDKSPRFKQVFAEYEIFSTELWNLETSDGGDSIPDDFIEALQLQMSYLEDEIKDWLQYKEDSDTEVV
ncbi:hypothetical protein KRE40_15950 [Elizabethkingia meningoseptica]|uniref:Uncharacterized protein n=1 Tax=Elizabethkingia meningoseptica TaxID=238 RepID=A0A1V3U4G0_ELIME|nr:MULTISPECIES: hypothetical protein [Elizabethkingia]AQX04867.1 hypothetical protein BBD33_06225 [Elizabethkingia meningoseptica]AQX12326.1 hypothetical protein BBD35_08050 [Elizabethkingia meningoseptica]AQX46907.1 hypothetical protein B5G46_06215 [Elizabethkingia meningoseptica]EJK5330639.1 hypothetical protein [Elizabethkingia meningoseptica]EOR29264.1 hypothetical protein L100_12269 [Elizabethkingia meningoseptica ATCC 13253 = NBRC 12535]